MKILVTDPLAQEGIQILEEAGFTVEQAGKMAPEVLANKIKGFDALVVRSATKVPRGVIEAADTLKAIGRAGVGLDNVDLEAATEKGVIVMNSPEGNTISTAEHAVALMFSLARNIPRADASMKNGRWDRKNFTGTELFRKVLGIIGFGRVGERVAHYGKSLGMEVLVFDPYISREKAEKTGVLLADKDDLLRKADLVTLHAPLTDQTRCLIGKKELGLMKKTAFLINTARGELVDEEALAEALRSGEIKGAALDVFTQEPPENPALLECPGLVLTPHLGASTEEAQDNVARDLCRQLCDYLQKGVVTNAANLPSVSGQMIKFIQPYLTLCEKMGLFLAQSSPGGGISSVKLEYCGELADFDLAPLQHAFLKGLLSLSFGAAVNYINAPLVARQRGISCLESKTGASPEFANVINAVVISDKGEASVSGTLFGKNEPRLVKIEGYLVDAYPSGYLLFCSNEDKPGIIGKIGTILASAGVNIAGMTLGRKVRGGPAITILNVDAEIPGKIMEEIQAIKEIKRSQLIVL